MLSGNCGRILPGEFAAKVNKPLINTEIGCIARAVASNKKWLADTNSTWERGLDLAEFSAHLLEAGELIAMYDPPTRTVDLLRKGAPNMAALRTAIEKYTATQPFQIPQGDPGRTARPPASYH